MIVKVQLSICSNAGAQQVLIYNEDRSISWQGPATKEIVERMAGEQRAFFRAYMSRKRIRIGSQRLPEQGW